MSKTIIMEIKVIGKPKLKTPSYAVIRRHTPSCAAKHRRRRRTKMTAQVVGGTSYRSLFACRKPKKLLGYFWRKIEKGPNLGHFDPFLGRNPGTRFFFKNRALSLLSFYQYLTSCEVSRKSLEPFSRKTHN